MSATEAVLILLGVGGLAIAGLTLRVNRRAPLTSAEIKAAEDLATVARSTRDEAMHPPFGEIPPDWLANIRESWTAAIGPLDVRLNDDLRDRIASVTTLFELGARLELYRDTAAWMEAAHWAIFSVERAAKARSQLKRDREPRFFPPPHEVRDLLAKGQSLNSGLTELDDRTHAIQLEVIGREAQANKTRGIVVGATATAGSVLLLLALFSLLR
jgi:hypothetical protein